MDLHLLQNKQSLFWVKWIFIYSRKNKVFSGLNEYSSTSQPIKNLFFFYSFFLKKEKFPKFIQNFGFN